MYKKQIESANARDVRFYYETDSIRCVLPSFPPWILLFYLLKFSLYTYGIRFEYEMDGAGEPQDFSISIRFYVGSSILGECRLVSTISLFRHPRFFFVIFK